MDKKDKIVVFEDKKIRRIWHNKEWYFSVVDIIKVLVDSTDANDYWYRLKKREVESGGMELSTICRQLKLKSLDGKDYLTDCANKQGIFRIIQSIPSKRVEPFKLWLAKVGSERIDEIENPELAQERMKEIYEKKGYSKSWIDKRLRGIAVRQDLTDEWKKRGIEQENDFAILTAEISKATFGMYPVEYKKFKRLQRENLRDHMTDLELIFSMLGEASTAEIERVQNPENFGEHREISIKGGEIAKNARLELEEETGESVVSDENYLGDDEDEVRKKKKKKIKIFEK
ncbi:MAG: Bro-N domain-containing protein [Nanoarchaeota archaeon]